MNETTLISSIEQVKALSDLVRLRILELLVKQPMTTRQVARALGEKPTRLYHHVTLLEQAGLIDLVDTRPNRGTIEKYYRAASSNYILDYAKLQGENAAPEAIQVLETLYSQLASQNPFKSLAEAPIAAGKSMIVVSGAVRASAKTIDRLRDQLLEWIKTCQAIDDPEGEEVYDLIIGFFPRSKTTKEEDTDR